MHRYLLFDSGCSTCTELARTIEDETDGWLTARSLREPEVQELLDFAQSDWSWEPTLLEVDGEDVRAHTGLHMRLRLLRGLGPRTAWRVAQLVREAGVPLGSVDLGRRELLRRGGALLAGLALWPGSGGSMTASTEGGSEQAPITVERADQRTREAMLNRARTNPGVRALRHIFKRARPITVW